MSQCRTSQWSIVSAAKWVHCMTKLGLVPDCNTFNGHNKPLFGEVRSTLVFYPRIVIISRKQSFHLFIVTWFIFLNVNKLHPVCDKRTRKMFSDCASSNKCNAHFFLSCKWWNVSAALLYRVFIASAFLPASPMLTIVRKGWLCRSKSFGPGPGPGDRGLAFYFNGPTQYAGKCNPS